MDPKNIIVTFPELLIWLPLIGGILTFLVRRGSAARNLAFVVSLLTLGVSLASLALTSDYYDALNRVSYFWLPSIGSSFALALDGMGKMLCFLTALAFPVIMLSTARAQYKRSNVFFGLMLLSQSGLMGVFCAYDALVFYFFWELALIPVYFLAGQWGGERRVQASFKFFIYTFSGSLLLLIGIIYVYLNSPSQSFSLASFYNAALPAASQKWVFWLFFIAFAIKMPIFPFHTWQPDLYEQSDPAVTMVLSGIMVKMGLFAVIRWLLPVVPAGVHHWEYLVIALAVIGMIYASCLALVQDDIKRLTAYSSIAHIGLMCAGIFVTNQSGLQGVMIQMFSHGVNIIGMWIVVGLIERQLGTTKISKLGGLATQSPTLAVLLVIVALANISLPLTNAFVGEFLLFNGLFQYNGWWTAFAGLSIILSAVYTLGMIRRVFFGATNPLSTGFRPIGRAEVVVLSVIVVAVFLGGIYPKPFFTLTQDTVTTILNYTKK